MWPPILFLLKKVWPNLGSTHRLLGGDIVRSKVFRKWFYGSLCEATLQTWPVGIRFVDVTNARDDSYYLCKVSGVLL